MPKTQILKTWDDWSKGIGFLFDDPTNPGGMYFSSGILGLQHELRPAPFFNSVTMRETMNRLASAVNKNVAMVAAAVAPASSSVTVTFDSTKNNSGAGATLTLANHVVANQSNRYLFVFVSSVTNVPDTVVFNTTESLTLISTASETVSGYKTTLWGLAAPSVTTANIVITFSGATTAAGGSIGVYNASQTAPSGTALNTFTSSDEDSGYGIYVTPSSTRDLIIACSTDQIDGINSPSVQGPAETQAWRISGADPVSVGSYRAPLSGFHSQYFFEETTSSGNIYLYIERGNSTTYYITKISLNNATFGQYLGDHPPDTAIGGIAGQPARYQSFWYLPNRDVTLSKLTVGNGDINEDTLLCVVSVGTSNGEHLANLNHQLVAHLEDSGTRILSVDGNPAVDANWGQYFPCGDKNERATAIKGLEGATYILKKEGLYSFNNQGRSGLEFEDFRVWRNSFDNIPMSAWKKGLVIPHPSGLIFWAPGTFPTDIGLGNKQSSMASPVSGPPLFFGGRYHSTTAVADHIYAIYQPTPSSTTAYVLIGYLESADINNLVWQCLGSITLSSATLMSAVGVITSGKPDSTNYETPTLWFTNADVFQYIVLNNKAEPYRPRTETHRVQASGEVYLSELFFTTPHDLDKLVIYTQDMIEGDSWSVSMIADGNNDINVGSPITTNGRTELLINRHSVYRAMFHIAWASTVTSNRVPPTIKKIELYGRPLLVGNNE